jgi:GrpB-like predicted nucleotidyltransferase (UPF0157 family)
MIDIRDITPGESYACKFRVETMLDTLGRPAPNLSDVPLKGPGIYESFGFLKQRDTEQELVIVVDEKSNKEFVVAFKDLWDIDTVEFADE